MRRNKIKFMAAQPNSNPLIQSYFPFIPTEEQVVLFEKIEQFLRTDSSEKSVFILKGYAGTGKTTVIQSLTKALRKLGYRSMLLAPTGRAAKIISQYTKRKSYTIHRQIFKQVQNPFSGNIQFKLRKNYQEHTIFIVDEASMISHENNSGEETLLSDLIRYVFEHPSNKLIFIGDTAQLPPVGQNLSYALSSEMLRSIYDLRVYEHQLTEVVRHHQESGILENATRLRQQLQTKSDKIDLHTKPYQDIYRMFSSKLTEGLSYAYLKYGIKNTLIICPSNQEATQYNQYVRKEILHRSSEIEAGDLIMIVRNNYRVLPKSSRVGFLANGEFAEVVDVISFEEQYGFHFANLLLRLPDYPRQNIFESKVMLDTLYSHLPTLSTEESKILYDAVSVDYQHILLRSRQLKAIRKDAYLNALQIKFAYALTCHKAQGGQWQAVFIHPGYLGNSPLNLDTIRWLYTAFTRATQELFLLDFHKTVFY